MVGGSVRQIHRRPTGVSSTTRKWRTWSIAGHKTDPSNKCSTCTVRQIISFRRAYYLIFHPNSGSYISEFSFTDQALVHTARAQHHDLEPWIPRPTTACDQRRHLIMASCDRCGFLVQSPAFKQLAILSGSWGKRSWKMQQEHGGSVFFVSTFRY